jgi:hypothetical protein
MHMKTKKIQIKFQNGVTSTIDENVHKLIIELEQKIKTQRELPSFFNPTKAINQYNKNKLDDLFKKNNYVRVFKELTQFDAWYILKD